MPILLYFVRSKRPSGNYYVTFLCTENPGLIKLMVWMYNLIGGNSREDSTISGNAVF